MDQKDLQVEELTFTGLPDFPKDVKTAPLLRISLSELVDGSQAEIDRLWSACTQIGFFYLDLRSQSTKKRDSAHEQGVQEGVIDGEGVLANASELFSLGEQFFDLPMHEKLKYDFREQGSYFGYKRLGAGVIDDKGTKDRNEFYNTSKDYVFELQKALPEPELLRTHTNRALMKDFMTRSHAIVALILDLLNSGLQLPDGKLKSLHRLHAISGDQVRWVKSLPQPVHDRKKALGEHTDFGSVTLLFNRLGGLQVLPPSEQEWAYVKPLKGHCVVNLGDALVKFSAGILRSNLHRVVNPPGAQADETRMSLVYFARPEDEVLLRALDESAIISVRKPQDEEAINARDWILRRALGRLAGGDFAASAGTEPKNLQPVGPTV